MSSHLPPEALWAFAVAPIILLVGLVSRSRLSTGTNAAITAAFALILGWLLFGANVTVGGVAVGKGLWTGLWILYVIWPALLLYQLASRAGLTKMGHVFSSILPREVENLLIVAWVFPSFVQGVAGFGTPIAVAAPILLAMGYGPVRAIAFPLVGYHWSVTFGSMGSSFYMGGLTAGLDGAELAAYARDASIILSVNLLLSGVLLCLMHGGVRSLRRGLRMLAAVGPLMVLGLLLAVHLEPAIGSLAAGALGFAGLLVLRRLSRRDDPDEAVAGARAARATARTEQTFFVDESTELPDIDTGFGIKREGCEPHTEIEESDTATAPELTARLRPIVVLLPYVYLLVLVLVVFLPPTSRDFVRTHFLIAPSFPETRTATGVVNPAVSDYTPIALLGHPGSYILLAALLGYVTYRVAGIWPTKQLSDAVRSWGSQAGRSTFSVAALTTIAAIMVDTGMVRVIAIGAADVTGALFPAVSPIIGALGSFTTGSTTTSNALFAALQRDVATLIDVEPSFLLAAQTAGGNVGNALAPVVILIGATAVDASDRVRDIFRAVLLPAAALITSVVFLTILLIAIG